MAGASMNGIKARIKSVESTMQITKAMELVATSKLRRAKEAAERTRPYLEILEGAIDACLSFPEAKESTFIKGNGAHRTLYIMIAGDRGLAGGYNSGIFRLTEALAKDKSAVFMPIGRKAYEYCSHRDKPLYREGAAVAQDFGVGESMTLSADIARDFAEGKIGGVVLVYTKFVSMLTQSPVYENLLPLEREPLSFSVEAEEEPEELLERIIPSYLGGIISSAVAESVASESGSRRNAMSAANKNAEEMIDTLMLKYNRARQAVITQEITEIISGREAL